MRGMLRYTVDLSGCVDDNPVIFCDVLIGFVGKELLHCLLRDGSEFLFLEGLRVTLTQLACWV